MVPEQLLSGIMTGMWEWMKANEYIYFIIAVIAIVLIGKLIKASLKAILKIAGVALLIYLGWELLQMLMEVI